MFSRARRLATPEHRGLDGNGQLISQRTNVGAVVTRIENILESIIDSMSEREELTLEFSRRSAHSSGRRAVSSRVHFPGRNHQEALKFARVLLILQLSHDALVTGTILTKRHIFYQHQDLFGTQRVVDELVDDIAFTLGFNRDELNIVASAKGLVSGPIVIKLHDGTSMDASIGETGTPIPPTSSIATLELDTARWMLVIEKDASFRSLSSLKFWQTAACGPGLLVTVRGPAGQCLNNAIDSAQAKGYPDLITRSFLNLVQEHYPLLQMLMLADFDPDGLAIFRCYRYGSDKFAHETGANGLDIHWLGIKSQQIMKLDASGTNLQRHASTPHDSQSSPVSNQSRASIISTNCRESTPQLTLRDRKLATGALAKLCAMSSSDGEVVSLTRELQLMLIMGIKAEIQWLDDAGCITDWLDKELSAIMS